MFYIFIDAQDQLMDIYERLEDMSADTAEARAAEILHGLGFDKEMQVLYINYFFPYNSYYL